jgi:hypothetical protein
LYPAPDVPNPYSAPYISAYTFAVSSYITERTSAAITADWRLGRVDRLSFGLQYAYMDQVYGSRTHQIVLGSAIDLDNTTMEHVEGTGYVRSPATSRKKITTTWMPTLTYRHLGSLWKIEAGAGWSRADLEYTDTSNGYFRYAAADRGTLKFIMDKAAGEKTPHNIEAYVAGTDTPVDYHLMNEYVITLAYTRPAKNYNEKRTYYANAQRGFMVFGAPLLVKAGLDIRHQITDQTSSGYMNYRYLGPDGVYPANTGYDRPFVNGTTPDASDNDAAGFEENFAYPQVSKLFGLGDFQFLNNALV